MSRALLSLTSRIDHDPWYFTCGLMFLLLPPVTLLLIYAAMYPAGFLLPVALLLFAMVVELPAVYAHCQAERQRRRAELERARERVRDLVAEVQQLCHAAIPPHVFFPAFVRRTVQALAAIDGAVWLLDSRNQFRLAYVANPDSQLWNDIEHHVEHETLLHRVVTDGQGEWVAPANKDNSGRNPTEHLLLAQPLRSRDRVRGVVEVFQRRRVRTASRDGQMRFLRYVCQIAGAHMSLVGLDKVR